MLLSCLVPLYLDILTTSKVTVSELHRELLLLRIKKPRSRAYFSKHTTYNLFQRMQYQTQHNTVERSPFPPIWLPTPMHSQQLIPHLHTEFPYQQTPRSQENTTLQNSVQSRHIPIRCEEKVGKVEVKVGMYRRDSNRNPLEKCWMHAFRKG
jgi:hypothetical protein